MKLEIIKDIIILVSLFVQNVTFSMTELLSDDSENVVVSFKEVIQSFPYLKESVSLFSSENMQDNICQELKEQFENFSEDEIEQLLFDGYNVANGKIMLHQMIDSYPEIRAVEYAQFFDYLNFEKLSLLFVKKFVLSPEFISYFKNREREKSVLGLLTKCFGCNRVIEFENDTVYNAEILMNDMNMLYDMISGEISSIYNVAKQKDFSSANFRQGKKRDKEEYSIDLSSCLYDRSRIEYEDDEGMHAIELPEEFYEDLPTTVDRSNFIFRLDTEFCKIYLVYKDIDSYTIQVFDNITGQIFKYVFDVDVQHKDYLIENGFDYIYRAKLIGSGNKIILWISPWYHYVLDVEVGERIRVRDWKNDIDHFYCSSSVVVVSPCRQFLVLRSKLGLSIVIFHTESARVVKEIHHGTTWLSYRLNDITDFFYGEKNNIVNIRLEHIVVDSEDSDDDYYYYKSTYVEKKDANYWYEKSPDELLKTYYQSKGIIF